MPKDTEFPFEFNDTGDVGDVDGNTFYQQHALLLVLVAQQQVRANAENPTSVAKLQSVIEQRVAESPYFEPPVTTQITEFDLPEVTIFVDASNRSVEVSP